MCFGNSKIKYWGDVLSALPQLHSEQHFQFYPSISKSFCNYSTKRGKRKLISMHINRLKVQFILGLQFQCHEFIYSNKSITITFLILYKLNFSCKHWRHLQRVGLLDHSKLINNVEKLHFQTALISWELLLKISQILAYHSEPGLFWRQVPAASLNAQPPLATPQRLLAATSEG